MLDVNIGEVAVVDVTFTNSLNQPMAATDVVISARRPDGSVIVGTVEAGASEGQFRARFLGDQAGVWLAKAECGGPEIAKEETRWTCSRLLFDAA